MYSLFICVLVLALIGLNFHSQPCQSSVLYLSISKYGNAYANIKVFCITKEFLSIWEYYPKYGTQQRPDMQLNEAEFHSRQWKKKKKILSGLFGPLFDPTLLRKRDFLAIARGLTGLYPDTDLSIDILGPHLVLEERGCFNFRFLMHLGEKTSYLQKTKK